MCDFTIALVWANHKTCLHGFFNDDQLVHWLHLMSGLFYSLGEKLKIDNLPTLLDFVKENDLFPHVDTLYSCLPIQKALFRTLDEFLREVVPAKL